MSPTDILGVSIWILLCDFGVASSDRHTGLDDTTKALHVMHFSRYKLLRYNMKPMLTFMFDVVNNDTRHLTGYHLNVINGFTEVSVSVVFVSTTSR